MKISEVWENKEFDSGVKLTDIVDILPTNAENVVLSIVGEKILVSYSVKVMVRGGTIR